MRHLIAPAWPAPFATAISECGVRLALHLLHFKRLIIGVHYGIHSIAGGDWIRQMKPNRFANENDARAALVSGLLVLVGLGLIGVHFMLGRSDWVWRVRDPEYGRKLTRLHRLMRHGGSDRPLVLFLGSSRTGVSVRPDSFAPRLPAADKTTSSPLYFNFALCRSGPLLQLLCLRRLLADGVRPDWILIEAWPHLMTSAPAEEFQLHNPQRFHWRDIAFLSRYQPHSFLFVRDWWQAGHPLSAPYGRLSRRILPGWSASDRNEELDWQGLDSHGWLSVPHFAQRAEPERWSKTIKAIRAGHRASFQRIGVNRDSNRVIRKLLATCRQHGIKATLVLYPDPFDSDYDPKARAALARYLEKLHDEEGVSTIDLRQWLPLEAFRDGVHMTHAVAAEFSVRLYREVISPLLAADGALTSRARAQLR